MLKRGYKTWCENNAALVRKELGLAAADPLSPSAYASHLGVLLWTPAMVPGLDPSDLAQLTQTDPSSWSALTLRSNDTCLVIVNSAHSAGRQANSIVHELAHFVLGHKAARLDVSELGHLLLESYDPVQEEEADWLAGTLLLPRPALLLCCENSDTTREIAQTYGVSIDLVDWRLRMTGVATQVSRRRSRQQQRSRGC